MIEGAAARRRLELEHTTSPRVRKPEFVATSGLLQGVKTVKAIRRRVPDYLVVVLTRRLVVLKLSHCHQAGALLRL